MPHLLTGPFNVYDSLTELDTSTAALATATEFTTLDGGYAPFHIISLGEFHDAEALD